MKAEDIKFNSEEFGDFVLYRAKSDIFVNSFQNVIDDFTFNVTHLIDSNVKFN